MTSATICILIAIVVYLVLMLYIGVRFAKKNNNADDFYLGGRKLGPLVTEMCIRDRVEFALTDRIPGEYHGTGDVFSSVLTGALVRGRKLTEAAALAAKFVRDCAERTFPQGTPMREGVDFEPLLYTIGADRL